MPAEIISFGLLVSLASSGRNISGAAQLNASTGRAAARRCIWGSQGGARHCESMWQQARAHCMQPCNAASMAALSRSTAVCCRAYWPAGWQPACSMHPGCAEQGAGSEHRKARCVTVFLQQHAAERWGGRCKCRRPCVGPQLVAQAAAAAAGPCPAIPPCLAVDHVCGGVRSMLRAAASRLASVCRLAVRSGEVAWVSGSLATFCNESKTPMQQLSGNSSAAWPSSRAGGDAPGRERRHTP